MKAISKEMAFFILIFRNTFCHWIAVTFLIKNCNLPIKKEKMKINKLLFTSSIIATLIVSQSVKSQEFPRTLRENVIVTADADKIVINFTEKGNYKVYQGKSVETIDWDNPTVLEATNKMEVNRPKDDRLYFAVINEVKDTLIVSERKILFKNVVNLRDLGGIETKDGRYTQWGRFYRSDALVGLQKQDFEAFRNLKIAKVYDLRSDFETEKAPDHLPKTMEYIPFSIFDAAYGKTLQEMGVK